MTAEDPQGFKALSARGGLTMVARHGRDSNLSRARAATRARWIAEVDPQGVLTPEALEERLAFKMRAQITKMVDARRRLREARQAAAE